MMYTPEWVQIRYGQWLAMVRAHKALETIRDEVTGRDFVYPEVASMVARICATANDALAATELRDATELREEKA